MKKITDVIRRELRKMDERGWDCIYVFIDIHDTILKACYHEPERFEWLGDSKEALQKLSKDQRFRLVLWSSTHEKFLERYLEVFKEHGVVFQYSNVNPEVKSDSLGCFDKKPYFNVIIDDKAGFDPGTDWTDILETEL